MVWGPLSRLWPFATDDGGPDAVDDADGDTEDDGQVRTWDFVPAWQYGGWQVETGGLTVDEQESALSDVKSQAEAVEEAAADDPSDR
ncbi:hypothetical protein HWV07_07570 [Natronomonas salina]|uniref:hypothetical protein n=1 Tax=Natronomonas salina TaxID=1710540 RepID=UPI0015B48CFB|nr:hypothetical protein [Natronomonas salina]QLD88896.1 hypothetical protein HWV07_07570 [Natronomonas salina]